MSVIVTNSDHVGIREVIKPMVIYGRREGAVGGFAPTGFLNFVFSLSLSDRKCFSRSFELVK